MSFAIIKCLLRFQNAPLFNQLRSMNTVISYFRESMAAKHYATSILLLIGIVLVTSCSEEKKNQFQGKAKGEVIGKCPRCGADVQEGKVNFYCSDRNCTFTLWKNDKFLASQGKKMDKTAAKKFLSKGKIHYKDLVSRKTGRQYEATVEMVDPGEGNVQFNLIFPQR